MSQSAQPSSVELDSLSSKDESNSPITLAVAGRSVLRDLIANQPRSLAGIPVDDRGGIVVSAVFDEEGLEHVLSRYRAHTWHFGSEIRAKNIPDSARRLVFDPDLPQSLMQDVRAVIYAAMHLGRPNCTPWQVRTAASALRSGHVTLRALVKRGVTRFDEVTPQMLEEIATEMSKSGSKESIGRRMTIIQLVWEFPLEVVHPLRSDPWSGKRFSRTRGFDGNDVEETPPSGRSGKTPVIPPQVQRAMFAQCESILDEAKGRIAAGQAVEAWDPFSIDLRDAVLYLVQITSGMRISESTAIRANGWRQEQKLGTTLHWIATTVIKGGVGATEFLAPPEAIAALEALQCFAAPLQARLREEAKWLRELLSQKSDSKRPSRKWMESGLTRAQTIQRLNHIKEIQDCLFLGVNNGKGDHTGDGTRVDVLSLLASVKGMNRLAQRCGCDWHLANHQCRRTFAYNVANSRLGRRALVFLKWQLKHDSIAWTELYGANPRQDHSLYAELYEEQIAARAELMEGWMDPHTLLSGAAGKKIMQARGIPVPNLHDLMIKTAEAIDLTSTGHSWCLGGASACNGQGLYDPTMCGPSCGQAVIDPSVGETWQMIHLENLRLTSITDCGEAVAMRGKRAIAKSRQVLAELGVPVPNSDQEEQYRRSTEL